MMFGSILSTLIAVAGAAPTPSNLVISPCDAGEHYQFETVDCPFELRNTGSVPIHISNARSRFPWDTIQSGTITVPPNGAAYIDAKVDLRNSLARTVRQFQFDTDEHGGQKRGSEIRAFVLSVLDQPKPTLGFGTVKIGDPLPQRSIELSSREVKDFRIISIEAKPEWLDAHIGADGRTIVARLKPDVPWGLIHHDYFVKLKINSTTQPEAWIAVEAQVLGDVLPDGNPFQLGLMRTSDKHQFLVRLSSESGKDFEIGNLKLEGIEGSVKAESCSPSKAGCRLIRLDVSNKNRQGKLEGVLRVDLPKLGKVLPIELVGVLISPETKIHTMDELTHTSEGAESRASPTGVDLSKALVNSVKEQAPPPPGNGPLLKWSVAHQESIYGYVIYRADSASGPFLRVNKELIHAVGEGDDNSWHYQWRDNSAVSGKTYWYSIGMINRDGSRQDLTGAQKVTAK